MNEVEDRLASLLPRLRRFAHGLARDSADADDLVQATAERILKSQGQWQRDTNFAAWAYRVMRTCGSIRRAAASAAIGAARPRRKDTRSAWRGMPRRSSSSAI